MSNRSYLEFVEIKNEIRIVRNEKNTSITLRILFAHSSLNQCLPGSGSGSGSGQVSSSMYVVVLVGHAFMGIEYEGLGIIEMGRDEDIYVSVKNKKDTIRCMGG